MGGQKYELELFWKLLRQKIFGSLKLIFSYCNVSKKKKSPNRLLLPILQHFFSRLFRLFARLVSFNCKNDGQRLIVCDQSAACKLMQAIHQFNSALAEFLYFNTFFFGENLKSICKQSIRKLSHKTLKDVSSRTSELKNSKTNFVCVSSSFCGLVLIYIPKFGNFKNFYYLAILNYWMNKLNSK